MVSIMKIWTPLIMTSLCMVLLPVLGGMKQRPSLGDMLTEECWGEPTIRECNKRCSRSFKCIAVNHTCCWTYCGNICWETKIPPEDR
ncbi:protein WFDC11 [Equus asinus]|uniref:WAP four-disulfide core domain 11 n=3 Tax=Equus TaxID=9789 RepID=A0A3Q2GTU8_HORSE|nr:protein WFDC11 [Equus caballus]XP_008519889.1 PREDICTED: protein WFDC11 [Equus przewalskii]XP_014715333.1 protein WFDC11 [Equus asinus]XP_014715334.1 protein WFDC11 [Equus asinus]